MQQIQTGVGFYSPSTGAFTPTGLRSAANLENEFPVSSLSPIGQFEQDFNLIQEDALNQITSLGTGVDDLANLQRIGRDFSLYSSDIANQFENQFGENGAVQNFTRGGAEPAEIINSRLGQNTRDIALARNIVSDQQALVQGQVENALAQKQFEIETAEQQRQLEEATRTEMENMAIQMGIDPTELSTKQLKSAVAEQFSIDAELKRAGVRASTAASNRANQPTGGFDIVETQKNNDALLKSKKDTTDGAVYDSLAAENKDFYSLPTEEQLRQKNERQKEYISFNQGIDAKIAEGPAQKSSSTLVSEIYARARANSGRKNPTEGDLKTAARSLTSDSGEARYMEAIGLQDSKIEESEEQIASDKYYTLIDTVKTFEQIASTKEFDGKRVVGDDGNIDSGFIAEYYKELRKGIPSLTQKELLDGFSIGDTFVPGISEFMNPNDYQALQSVR